MLNPLRPFSCITCGYVKLLRRDSLEFKTTGYCYYCLEETAHVDFNVTSVWIGIKRTTRGSAQAVGR
jgi:hypothetical protein